MKFRQRNGKSKRRANEKVGQVVSGGTSIKKNARGPKRKSGKSRPPKKAFKITQEAPSISLESTNQKIPAKQRRLFEALEESKRSKKEASGKKLSLATSSKDYDGNLNLPETVNQKQYETTAQFLRRLNRLTAKAKVEADIEARFEVDLSKKAQS